MAGSHTPNGRRQNCQTGLDVESSRWSQEERMTKNELADYGGQRSQANGDDLGRGGEGSGGQAGVEKLCFPMCWRHGTD